VAEEQSDRLVAHVRAFGEPIEAVTPAGSLRRCKETVGDLDIWSSHPRKHTPKNVEAISEHILGFPGIDQTLARGETKSVFMLKNGMQVDVRILEKKNFGAALLISTGSEGTQRRLTRPRE